MAGVIDSDVAEKNAETAFIAWYEDICSERISMLEAEEGYKRRIGELERSNADLLQAFNEAQTEINHVRAKYEPQKRAGELVYTETYAQILSDRDRLKKENDDIKAKLDDARKNINELTASLTGEHQDRKKVDKGDQPTRSSEKPKTKPTHAKSKMCYLITGKDRIMALENDNLKLRLKLKDAKDENESFKLKINDYERKLDHVNIASKSNVNTFKHLNGAINNKTLTRRRNLDVHKNDQMTSLSASKITYKSMFVSRNFRRKLTHNASTLSLPSIRNTETSNVKVDRELLNSLSRAYSRRSVLSDVSSQANREYTNSE